jgi:hypothetical protein
MVTQKKTSHLRGFIGETLFKSNQVCLLGNLISRP